jgi:Glycerophosphoryl diester phosphodiesterase
MLIYAHRGGRGCTPENTMAAFQNALYCKADGIELDVHLTKDNQIVICHDYKVNRTSDGHGLIKNFNLHELKQLDFGSWFSPNFRGQKILTLEEYLNWHINTPLLLNIEIKNGPVMYRAIEEKIVSLIDYYNIVNRVTISSFHHPSLLKVKELNPTVRTGALFEGRPINPCQLAIDAKADFLHPFWQNLDTVWVSLAHSLGIGINTYTVNTHDELNFVRSVCCEAIITDYPNQLKNKT